MFYLYCLIFVVIGVPLVGYTLQQFIRLGKLVYRKYPFVRKFFDEYAENFGIGALITVSAGLIYIIARYFGLV